VNAFSYRFAELRIWSILLLLVLILGLLGGMIWRNFDRFETIQSHVIYGHRIHQLASDIQSQLTDYFVFRKEKPDRTQLNQLSSEILDLANNDHHAAPETPQHLANLREIILELGDSRKSTVLQEANLIKALNITSAMMDDESLKRERVLQEIGQSTRTEVLLVFAMVFTLLLVVGIFLKFRILTPLNDLKKLLLRLAREDFSPIDADRIDPILLPVFNSYNFMVDHLAELEEAKREHAASLEREVRTATRALLEQQADLARNERLAAVGELAAGIAHELRNPLAGIQMSCANLHTEIQDADQVDRVGSIIEELKRMARLLNELLDLSKHSPDPISNVDLTDLIRDLVALTRYQIPPNIQLAFKAPAHLLCMLPEGRLRQSLLNLILNASQALSEAGAGGAILISVHESMEDELITLSVSDDGPGFSQELLKTGVRPFVTGKPGGTGLGLAMVQRFVREMGGQMHIANLEPHGATVRVVLPYVKSE
jgi:signal transduction histidine kinase